MKCCCRGCCSLTVVNAVLWPSWCWAWGRRGTHLIQAVKDPRERHTEQQPPPPNHFIYDTSSQHTRIAPCNTYMYKCDFFFLRAHLFVLAPLSQTSGGVGTILPSGSRCRRFERDPCRCVARGKPFELFWPWVHLRQIPGFPQNPRGMGFCIPYPRTCT